MQCDAYAPHIKMQRILYYLREGRAEKGQRAKRRKGKERKENLYRQWKTQTEKGRTPSLGVKLETGFPGLAKAQPAK
eukprot:1159416-Pelagomonas_calceolata.AAC.10